MKNTIITMFILCISTFAYTQDYEVTFAAHGIGSVVDSVQIENITQNKSISIAGSDVLNLLGFVDNKNIINENENFQIYPNPTGDIANASFYSTNSENVLIKIFDVSGKLIGEKTEYCSIGSNSFSISGLSQGLYIVNLQSESFKQSSQLIITGSNSNELAIKSATNDFSSEKIQKATKSTIPWQYNDGDILIFKGFSGGHSRIYVYYVNTDAIINFDFVLCQDSDGQKYTVTSIGTEIYMAENLRTTKYNNGIPIDKVDASPSWADLTAGAYCYYDNDSLTNAATYGTLYNFTAVITGNLCPNGWHVPSDTEWQDLFIFLQNNGYNYTGINDNDNDHTTFNQMTKSICSTTDWADSDIEGTPGSTDYPNYRNRSGFSAKPAGMLSPIVGSTSNMHIMANWWTSTEYSETNAKRVVIITDMEGASFLNLDKTFGLSVRCVKD